MRDGNIARLRQHESFAGVAIRRRRVKPVARPGAAETENVDHELEVTNRWIVCRHGAAADCLDGRYAGVVGSFRKVARAYLTRVGWVRRYQIRQELGKQPEKSMSSRSKPT